MEPRELKLTPEELEKVRRAKSKGLSPEWAYISEFGQYYGFEGILAILENKITIRQSNELLKGGRAVVARQVVDSATANFVGTAAANSKRPKSVFKKGLKEYFKQAKG